MKKVLFYTSTARAFRTTLIGNLYEIAQVFPVILLSEKLDPETERAIKNRKLFPKLKKIIMVNQFSRGERISFEENKRLYRLAKKTVEQFKPDIVISLGDIYPGFELYLMRLAKRAKSMRIVIQAFTIEDVKKARQLVYLTNAHQKLPFFFPIWFRIFLIRLRNYFGHFLYYWIMPLAVNEKPFFGKSSYLLRKGSVGMRDSDYLIVFSKRYFDICVKNGVPAKKIFILKHPLERETRKFFQEVFLSGERSKKKTVLLLLPEDEIGFKKDYSLVSKEEIKKTRLNIIGLVFRTLKGWEIIIKPHPNVQDIEGLSKDLKVISSLITIINREEPIDKYIEASDVVVSLPRSATSAIYTALLQCPEKPILALDLNKELLGDDFKNFEGIEYIDDEKKLVSILELIRDNKYHKKNNIKSKLELNEFSNTIEMLEYLFQKNNFISQ